MEKHYCEHEDCRKEAAANLMWMAKRLRRADLAEESILALRATVPCCREGKPRRGHTNEDAPLAPLAPRRE